jgi:hypothetical protein
MQLRSREAVRCSRPQDSSVASSQVRSLAVSTEFTLMLSSNLQTPQTRGRISRGTHLTAAGTELAKAFGQACRKK